ncbi:MAG: hypothetical protein JO206_09310, partial [Solirubrobacterales bacterium]|nr:hypothetical protein [Solirubrobacterales bacterium]
MALAAAAVVAAVIVIAQSGGSGPRGVHAGNRTAAPLFAASSVWNAPVPATAALDSNSSSYVAQLDAQVSHYGPFFNTNQYSFPVYTVGSGQPTLTVSLDAAAGSQPDLQQAWRAVPLPANAKPASGTDANL